MISIIVPVYKAEPYIHRCIDSILAQSYTDFELLLIDDGSPDSSGAICEEYAATDCRVRVFHKSNGGVSSARNLGLDNARGEYITFCDADDYVGVDWLTAYRDAITEDIDLVIQGYYIVDGDRTIEKNLFSYLGNTIESKRELITSLMCQGIYGYLWVKLLRRQIIEDNHIRFDEQSAFREDEQFFSEYLKYVNTFRCIDSANYYYIAPHAGKTYKGDAYYSLLPIFQSLDMIFDRELPREICQLHFENIKDAAVQYILLKKEITFYHMDLYKRISAILGYDRNIKNILLKFLIIEGRSHPLLSRSILNLIHKLTIR